MRLCLIQGLLSHRLSSRLQLIARDEPESLSCSDRPSCRSLRKAGTFHKKITRGRLTLAGHRRASDAAFLRAQLQRPLWQDGIALPSCCDMPCMTCKSSRTHLLVLRSAQERVHLRPGSLRSTSHGFGKKSPSLQADVGNTSSVWYQISVEQVNKALRLAKVIPSQWQAQERIMEFRQSSSMLMGM